MSKEWFRRTTWSTDDKADFWRRLKRVRTTAMKAQYLRIQALYLQQAGTAALLRSALELLDVVVSDLQEETQMAMTQMQRAECLAALRQYDLAVAAYREAFAAQRSRSSIQTEAHLGFGELALTLQRPELYDEVPARMKEFGGQEAFPISQYRHSVVLALIHDARGKKAAARRYARQALDAAAKTESQFRYHRKLGLVGRQRPDIESQLLRLAGRTLNRQPLLKKR